MRFNLRVMFGAMLVLGLMFAAVLIVLSVVFHAQVYPLEQQQLMHLHNWRGEIKLYILRHNLKEWDSLAAVLRDFHIASSDQRLPESERERYRELVSYGSKDLWGSEIMILPGAKSPDLIIRSYGPNRRDDGGGGDDIEVEVNFR